VYKRCLITFAGFTARFVVNYVVSGLRQVSHV